MNKKEILRLLPDRKSLLADAAYTGGEGMGKKWINDMGFYCDGYNKALDDIRQAIELHFQIHPEQEIENQE